MHRMGQQLVKFRTAQMGGLRGLLTEYGEVMPKGRAGISRGIAAALEQIVERLPAMVVGTRISEPFSSTVLVSFSAGRRCRANGRCDWPHGDPPTWSPSR